VRCWHAQHSSCRTDGKGPAARRLLAAERAVLGAGGCVARLAGLYHARRGAHTFFLKAGRVERWGGYTVNLLHYEDAALLTAAVRAARRPVAPTGVNAEGGCSNVSARKS